MPVKKFKDPSSPSQSHPVVLKAPKSLTASGSELSLRGKAGKKNQVSSTRETRSTGFSFPKQGKEFWKDKWGNITGRTLEWLAGIDPATKQPRLEALLEETKLKEIGIFAGIGTEKVLLLEGQPTQIIGQAEQVKLDQLGAALKDVLEKRGLVTLTERKAEISLKK